MVCDCQFDPGKDTIGLSHDFLVMVKWLHVIVISPQSWMIRQMHVGRIVSTDFSWSNGELDKTVPSKIDSYPPPPTCPLSPPTPPLTPLCAQWFQVSLWRVLQ